MNMSPENPDTAKWFVEVPNNPIKKRCICCDVLISAVGPGQFKHVNISETHRLNQKIYELKEHIAKLDMECEDISEENAILRSSGGSYKLIHQQEREIQSLKEEIERLKSVPDELLKAEVEAEKQPLLEEIERLKNALNSEPHRTGDLKKLRYEHQQELATKEEFWEKIRVENNNLKDKIFEMEEQIAGDQVHKQNAQKTIAELRNKIECIQHVCRYDRTSNEPEDDLHLLSWKQLKEKAKEVGVSPEKIEEASDLEGKPRFDSIFQSIREKTSI